MASTSCGLFGFAFGNAPCESDSPTTRPPLIGPPAITPLKTFYKAEAYHQNYFNQNADRNPYCSVVIRPKLQKLLQKGLIKELAARHTHA